VTLKTNYHFGITGLELKHIEAETVIPPNPEFPPIIRVTLPHITILVAPDELIAIAGYLIAAALEAKES
jgi:hypothetical protein